MSVVINCPAQEPEEFVKAVRVGTEFRFPAEVPFPDQSRRITGFLEKSG